MTRQPGQAACDAGWNAWVASIGIVDYGRFRKAFKPILSDTYPDRDVFREVVLLWAAHIRSLKPNDRKWDAKPEVLASRFAEFYDMAAQPMMIDGRLTPRGELLTRPEGT